MRKWLVLGVVLALAVSVPALAAGHMRGHHSAVQTAQSYVGTACLYDANSDGICDYTGTCQNDANGDGICDYTGTCQNDANGDGICDYTGTYRNDANGDGICDYSGMMQRGSGFGSHHGNGHGHGRCAG